MKSIDRLKKFKPYLTSNYFYVPYVGNNPSRKGFNPSLNNLKKARDYMIDDIIEIDNRKTIDPEYNLSSGNPAERKVLGKSAKKVKELLDSSSLSSYNSALCSKENKQKLLEFVNEQGIVYDKNEFITIDNIIPTNSVTHAFELVLKSICREHDVVLFTAPCYGLFAYMPERLGAETRFIDLKEYDYYQINPQELDKRIKDINQELYKKYHNKLDYIPKVVAFLNENPHNPIGNVLTQNDLETIRNLNEVCANNGVFIIDDLIYQGTEYDLNNMALPCAVFANYFSNIISFFGVSKTFCLPGVRAGFVVANKIIINEIRNNIFYEFDSYSYLNEVVLSSIFNKDTYKENEQKAYLQENASLYSSNYELIKRFVNNKKHKIKLIKNLEVQSGFFVVLDFSLYKYMKYKNYTIKTEKDLLCFLYEYGGIRFITGESFAWPNKEQLIGRITFSMSKDKLSLYLNKLQETLSLLGD